MRYVIIYENTKENYTANSMAEAESYALTKSKNFTVTYIGE